MPNAHTVIAVNYHRIGSVDDANPLHRLHTVSTDVFTAQLDHMQHHGAIVSVDDVRSCRCLADTNFVITFDDVPTAAMTGIQMMLDRQLPVTVSVCTQLASTGWGTRDKVYCVDRFADPDTVSAAVRAAFPDAVGDGGPASFYHLTKRGDLDPGQVTATLIDPLFAGIEPLARPFLDGAGYLSWTRIRELADHPLVTIANHTSSHANLAALPPDRLADEITTAHEQLSVQLTAPPRYLTVPFGRLHQRLAIDCIDLVHPLGYHGILWVGDVATLITAPYDAQLLHLTRLHAPTTVEELVTRTRTLAEQATTTAVWQLPTRTHREPVTVVESSDPGRATRYEMLARQGKDYASSAEFYRYQFSTNPAKGTRPDYYAVQRDGRIEATAYNVHATFRVGAVTVPGVYLGSWRKLPDAHHTAAGALVGRMTAREAVVGVYHPSPIAAVAFAGWHQIPVWRLRLAVADAPGTLDIGGFGDIGGFDRSRERGTFDDAIAPLVDALMREADFTLVRDRAFYRWRYESYPLATCSYVMLSRRAEPFAYAVTLQRGDRIEIADWYAPSAIGYAHLVTAVQDSAREHRARTIEVETSNRAIAEDLAARFRATVTGARNYYHLNRARLAELGVTAADDLAARWPRLRFHETASTGDLLLR